MSAAWSVHDDGEDEPTLWRGNTAMRRRCEVSAEEWRVLTRVLAPDEATIERLAREVTARIAYDEDVVVTLTHREIRAVLAALTGTAAQDAEGADSAELECPSYREMTAQDAEVSE